MAWDPDPEFDAALDRYQQGLEDAAWQAEQRSYETAARPSAIRKTVTFADLRVGDYMTNEGASGRWVLVVEIRGPSSYVKSRHQAVKDGELSVLFEVPESVAVSGETQYWIERPADSPVTVDLTAAPRLMPSVTL